MMVRRRSRQSGFVLITMAAACIAMLGALGLAVDMGRIFIAKSETQAYVDAQSVAAALQLDGTSTGITNAINAATDSSNSWNYSATNKWNFDTSTIGSPTVDFATAQAGPWYSTDASLAAAGVSDSDVSYVRVQATVAVPMAFLPVVMTTKTYTQSVKSQAIAGQVSFSNSTSLSVGLAPFTGVASSLTGPNYGFTPGGSYDIQWPQYNSSRSQCNNGHPLNCFNKPPCASETTTAEQAVVNHWGSSLSGYWGSNSASVINQEILDQAQLQAVAVGTDLQPVLSNGQKQSASKSLDDRVNEDPANTETDYASYIADASHNGRRLIVVPLVNPSNKPGGGDQSPVIAYGEFFLQTNATQDYYASTKGNEPYCAIYVGPGNIGSNNSYVNTTSGTTRVRLMQ
jgi:Flp pilus assembly protein TadG